VSETLDEWEERVGLSKLHRDIEIHATYGVSGLTASDIAALARLVMISVRDYWPHPVTPRIVREEVGR
jgi:hypothetical protein